LDEEVEGALVEEGAGGIYGDQVHPALGCLSHK
jgi:hypothetical protein